MNFGNPSAFLLWILLGLLIVWRERSTRFTARLPFPALQYLAELSRSWRTQFLKVPQYLIYAGLALALVALARPRSVLKGDEAKARGIDIMMALDTSGSMRALDFNPKDRMAVAKQATKNFISHRQ